MHFLSWSVLYVIVPEFTDIFNLKTAETNNSLVVFNCNGFSYIFHGLVESDTSLCDRLILLLLHLHGHSTFILSTHNFGI